VNDETLNCNAACLRDEIEWFRAVLERRFKLHAGRDAPGDLLTEFEPPERGASGRHLDEPGSRRGHSGVRTPRRLLFVDPNA
jgi:hypothetical protein